MAALMCIHAQRETFRDEDGVRIHTNIIRGGDVLNVVPDTVVVDGMIRANNLTALEAASAAFDRAFEGCAHAIGATAEVEVRDGYPPLINDKDTVMMLAELADKAFGSDSYSFRYEPSLGGEDFSYFSKIILVLNMLVGRLEIMPMLIFLSPATWRKR